MLFIYNNDFLTKNSFKKLLSHFVFESYCNYFLKFDNNHNKEMNNKNESETNIKTHTVL